MILLFGWMELDLPTPISHPLHWEDTCTAAQGTHHQGFNDLKKKFNNTGPEEGGGGEQEGKCSAGMNHFVDVTVCFPYHVMLFRGCYDLGSNDIVATS